MKLNSVEALGNGANRNWKRFAAFLFFLAASTTLSCFTTGCDEEQISTEPVARPVKIMIIEGKAMANTFEWPGKVSPTLESYMAFEVPGRIIDFPVDEGQPVRKGAVLAKLDARDFQSQYDAEIAKLRQSKAEYERQSSLYEARSTSLAELQIKRRSFEVQKTRVRQAQKALQDTRLIAPFSGKVAKKLVKDFQNVRAKEPVLLLQDDSTLEIKINMPERDMAGVPNRSVEEITERASPMVTISSIPGRSFPARLKEIATTADPDTRTFEATLAFQPPRDVTILSGMTANVTATPPTEWVLSDRYRIPANSVVADKNGAAFVWLVDQESMMVRSQPVKVGNLSRKTQIEVQSGLSPGDWIAVSGVHHLREGMTVRRLEESPG